MIPNVKSEIITQLNVVFNEKGINIHETGDVPSLRKYLPLSALNVRIIFTTNTPLSYITRVENDFVFPVDLRRV